MARQQSLPVQQQSPRVRPFASFRRRDAIHEAQKPFDSGLTAAIPLSGFSRTVREITKLAVIRHSIACVPP
jgi:hypothetical protein